MSHAFISTVETTVKTTMSSPYRDAKHEEIIGLIVENKHLDGLEINLECVIITFNHGVLVFNVCCDPG